MTALFHLLEDGKVIMDFSGKELDQRANRTHPASLTADLRATFEAQRIYSMGSYFSMHLLKMELFTFLQLSVLIADEALDKKTPLLRSMEVH